MLDRLSPLPPMLSRSSCGLASGRWNILTSGKSCHVILDILESVDKGVTQRATDLANWYSEQIDKVWQVKVWSKSDPKFDTLLDHASQRMCEMDWDSAFWLPLELVRQAPPRGKKFLLFWCFWSQEIWSEVLVTYPSACDLKRISKHAPRLEYSPVWRQRPIRLKLHSYVLIPTKLR